MNSVGETLWRFVPAVRRIERGRFGFFAGLSALITFAQTLGLAGSEAIFLARLGAADLPLGFLFASLATVVGSLGYALIVGQIRNDRLFTGMLVAAASLLLVVAALLPVAPRGVPMALFCGWYVLQAVLINLHYWTFVTDFFDTVASKRLFPLLVVAASAGGAAGGVLGATLSIAVPPEALITAWSASLLAAAGLVHGGRNALRRWSPVLVAEADESSVEGLRGALRLVRRSSLARWLVTSVIGMVFALFLIQYLYLDVMARSYPSARSLAAFLGLYLALSNVLEIGFGRVVTPWAIRRLGVTQANLVHPLLAAVSLIGLLVDPRLGTAVFARASRESLENVLAAPVRNLTYNALPLRYRGRMRAFLEGLVFFASMSVAGAALLLMGPEIDVFWLAIVGAGASGLYFIANFRVRGEYLRSLLDELGRGRLDLGDLHAEIGQGEIGPLIDLWHSTLAETHERLPRILHQLAPLLAERGEVQALREALRHEQSAVRRLAVDAFSGQPELATLDDVECALVDPSQSVQLAGAHLAQRCQALAPDLRERLRRGLEHADPNVRAAIANALCNDSDEGGAVLCDMLESSDPAERLAAVAELPPALAAEALECVRDPDAAIRACAIRQLAEHGALPDDGRIALVAALHDEHSPVRSAAASALRAFPGEESASALARALDDPSRTVREEAQRALGSFGESALPAVEPLVASHRVWTATAALGTVAEIGTPYARSILIDGYRKRVREAWRSSAALELLEPEDGVPDRFLRAAHENALSRCLWLCFRTLELLEDPAVVRSVRKALNLGATRQRSDALEVLTHLGDRDTSGLLSLLLEEGSPSEKLSGAGRAIRTPRGRDEVVHEAESSHDRWLQRAAAGILAPERDAAEPEKSSMERLLALQNVSLFAHLSLEQLEAINGLMTEAEYLAGEIVVREGEPGEDLYVLLEGEVQAFKNHDAADETLLNTMTPVDYFGEMAILDSAPRSATCVVSKDARLLALAGERFEELILQTPEMAFEIFRVLIERVRRAEFRDPQHR